MYSCIGFWLWLTIPERDLPLPNTVPTRFSVSKKTKQLKDVRKHFNRDFVSPVQPLYGLGRRRDMADYSADILFQFFSLQVAIVSSSGMGRNVRSLKYFFLPTTATPTIQDALKDGFGKAVVACDTPQPCKFPSLDSCQKRFLRTQKEVDLAPQDTSLQDRNISSHVPS